MPGFSTQDAARVVSAGYCTSSAMRSWAWTSTPVLIDAAEADYPGPTWLVGDLAEMDLPEQGIAEGFDAIVCGGNVMTFCAPSTRGLIIERMGAHLRSDGRLVVGFGAGRGYEFSDFFADVEQAGLTPDLLLSTWDLRPFTENSDFLVAVLSRATS
ncbi:MAG: hypothetical protein M5U19_11840 [Microthrixaceae bacterium]|nr:hypothetical protein [Microthrixaceae bacterium]